MRRIPLDYAFVGEAEISVVALLDLVVPRGVLTSLVGTTAFYIFTLLIPLSIAVAVLRYHLYDIDTLINRTLVYGSLSVTLVALYFGGIVCCCRGSSLSSRVRNPPLRSSPPPS